MASILRSSKFIRYLAGFGRNAVLNVPREYDGSLLNTANCICATNTRPFVSQIPVKHEQSLEESLKRIDQDVRKSGRISRRDIEDVLEEIRSTRSATSSQSLLVIRCCGNLVPEEMPETRTKLVEEIWNTLNRLQVPMDVSHYNALLRVYLENEHPFSPTEFLSDLEAKGIEPNRVTYQRLIARYCQIGDIEGATKILEFMREKQLPVNENVFNALIVGHSQAGDMDSAHGIISVMIQAGLEPSADTYTTLLCGYAKNGDLDNINKIFDECNTKEIYLLDKDYLDIIYSLTTNGHGEHVPIILSKVRKSIGYNQDAINLILRLINKGYEDEAFLVLQSMPRQIKPDGTPQPTGIFFIKHLIKANRPIQKIIDICNRMEENEMIDRPLLKATEISLQFGNDTIAYPLLEELKKCNVEIRQHYFWPLIVSKSNDPSGESIIDVLINMNKFGCSPNSETLREYVIPNIKGRSSHILAKLREANISVGASAANLVCSLLMRNEIEEAAIISGQVNAYYNPDLIRRSLTSSFYQTKDLDSYITIIRNVYDNLDRRNKFDSDEQQQQTQINKPDIVGSLISDLCYQKTEFPNIIGNVLQELVNQGLSISTAAAERIQEKLGEKITDEISSLLGTLTSGELTPVPVSKKLPSYTPANQMSIPQLERLIQNLEAKNLAVKGYKRLLLSAYYRAKDLENTERILKELETNEDFIYTPGIYAQLIDLYSYHDNLERALHFYEKLKDTLKNDFTLDETKIIRLAHLLVKSNRLDDAINILKNTPKEHRQEERNFNYMSILWRFLNSLAEEGRVDDLNQLFNLLIEYDYMEPNNMLLGPLIKVHLIKNDLDKAMETFEWCVNKYKSTPWKSELACKLIQIEDGKNLQKLTDLSTYVHGEINSLYDLVFAFVECGRIRQARKILETPGLQNRPQRINSACERYREEGLVKPLEGLKDATKDLNHIDRTDIYYQLLLSYIKQEEVDKALGLWTQMQEEDLLPNDQFLNTLGVFLENSGVEVPFVIPKIVEKPTQESTQSTSFVDNNRRTLGPLNLFRQKLKIDDFDSCLELIEKHEKLIHVNDLSAFIEKCTQQNRLKDATNVTLKLLNRGIIPVNRIFKFLLNKLANNGDIDSLNLISSKINPDVKKIVSFDNRMCHANIVAGKAEEYLNKLDKDIDEATDDQILAITERFPRGGVYGILEKHPELIDKYENMAIKYVKRGIVAPINVLWTNYFIEGKDERADQIWNDYVKDSPRIMFQRVVQVARENKDSNLINKLIGHLKSSHVTEGAIGNAYSCLLDILVANPSGNINNDEIIKTFETAIKDVNIKYINRTAILRVKDIYNSMGKPFNYEIPPKTVAKTDHTLSSSGEDDLKKA